MLLPKKTGKHAFMAIDPCRRQFLRTSATVPVLLAAGLDRQAVNADTGRTPVVDSHLHCFAGRSSTSFPYHPRGPYQPEAAATPQHLVSCMDGAGVDYAIVVHPEPYQDDHRYLEYCLDVGKGRLKGTCLVFADRPDAVTKLKELAKKLPIVAVRLHAYADDRLPPFGTPELRAFWQAAGDVGIAVQVHLEPRYAPRVEPYIQEFKSVRVIIDHLGRPLQGTTKEHDVIVRWSRFPNTIMKVTGVVPPSQYPHRDIALFVKRLTEAYGADRLISGGGFSATATGASYRAERERVRTYLSHLSAVDQAKVFGGTAARLFGFATG